MLRMCNTLSSLMHFVFLMRRQRQLVGVVNGEQLRHGDRSCSGWVVEVGGDCRICGTSGGWRLFSSCGQATISWVCGAGERAKWGCYQWRLPKANKHQVQILQSDYICEYSMQTIRDHRSFFIVNNDWLSLFRRTQIASWYQEHHSLCPSLWGPTVRWETSPSGPPTAVFLTQLFQPVFTWKLETVLTVAWPSQCPSTPHQVPTSPWPLRPRLRGAEIQTMLCFVPLLWTR